MKRIVVLAAIVAVGLAGVYGVLTVYDETMTAGRMWETPAVRPHERPIPVMDSGVVPVGGGEARLRAADPADLAPPPELTGVYAVNRGEKAYVAYCAQCHGRYHDGNGTVGQSFHPLPGDLRTPAIQTMADGRIFKEISYGIAGGRQPALATTISVADRWRIVAYIKSLGVRP